ncbi:CHAT domain-containing protein [Leptodontidium sp. MPI-SDFR-AT-0119]|nr:CHAT domain-containing protein [Leptodontidium sp. MPI-SDFR-AT-0119]
MDFKELCQFFGGTIFKEESRGDLKKIREDLTKRDESRTSQDANEEAAVILIRAVWQLQSGEFRKAREDLEVLDDEKYGRRWRFRARLYKALRWLWESFPPPFKYDSRTTTDAMLALTMEASQTGMKIMGFTDNWEYITKYRLETMYQLSDIDILEYDIIRVLTGLCLGQMDYFRMLNTASRYFDDDAEETRACVEEIPQIQANIRTLQRLANQQQLGGVAAYLERLLYETAKAAGNISHMVEHLKILRSSYLAAVDWHGLGIYEMLRGDTIVSSDLTSPLMMNFKADIHVTDDEFGGFASQSWGLCENVTSEDFVLMQSETDMYRGLCDRLHQTQLPLVFGQKMQDMLSSISMLEDRSGVAGVLTASRHYLRAISFFQKHNEICGSGSSRGVAKGILSLACVIRLHAWQPKSLSDWNDEIDTASSIALSLLSQANRLFEQTGDDDMSNLVTVHQLLSSRSTIEEKAVVRAVGRRLQNSGNDALASFLGLLPYRMGIHYRYVCGDLHKASFCFDFSRQLFARIHLSNRTTWSRVQIAAARCLIDLGRNLAAKSMSSAMKGRFPIFSSIMNPNCGKGDGNRSDSAQSDDYGPLSSLLGPLAGAKEVDIERAFDVLTSDPERIRLNAQMRNRGVDRRIAGMVRDAFRDEKMNRVDPTALFGVNRHSLMQEVDAVLRIDAIVSDPDCFPDRETIQVIDALNIEETSAAWLYPGWQKARASEIVYRRAIRKWDLQIRSGDLQSAHRVLQQYSDQQSRAPPSEILGKTYLIDVLRKRGHLVEAKKMASQLSSNEMLPNENDLPQSNFERVLMHERRKIKSKEVIFHSQVNATAWTQARILMEELEDSSPGYFTSVSSYSQYLPWQRCFSAGLVYEGLGDFHIAWKYFLQAWELVQHLRLDLTQANDRRALAENAAFGRLINSLVRILLLRWKSEDSGKSLGSGVHTRVDTKIFAVFKGKESISEILYSLRFPPDKVALIILENNRALYVSDMMIASDRDEFDLGLRQLLYDQALFEEYSARVESLTNDEQIEFQKVKDLQGVDGVAEQRVQEFNLKRQAAGLREWGKDWEFDSVFAAIPKDALVIYTSLSEDGLCIFALETSEILYSNWRSDLSSSQIREKVLSCLCIVEQDLGQNAPEDCLPLLQELSDILLGALHDMIAPKSHIIFVPSGDLTRLPFGALVYDGKPLILQKAVSQTPNLAYLHLAQNSQAQEIPSRTSIIAKAGPQFSSDAEAPLPFAGIEALMVSHLHSSSQPLAANTLTRDKFRNEMETSTILHISTHGNVDLSSPLMSSISLAEKFRVMDLSLIRARTVDLAIFSACLTGQGQATASSDILGFPHAMLASGATLYIGALWTANDVVTMIHMYLFHSSMLNNADKSVAENWALATRQLYQMSHEDAANMLKMFVETWDKLLGDGRQPDKFVPGGKKLLQAVIRRLGTRRGKRELNFTHPYLWAPFSVVGDGRLIVTGAGRGSHI